MTAPEKPTIVFVPGAFHVPAHYSDIIAELQSRSYPALCVSLALTGSENPNLPPTASIDGVRQTLASLVNAGKEVLVVCHSAGAVAVAPCVKGLERSSGGDENGRGCVIGIVFMCAWLVPEGKAHLDILPGQGLPPWAEMEGNYLLPPRVGTDMFYHDLSDEAKETNFALLEPIVMGETTLPLTNTCWDSSVPKTYIITTDDRAIEPSLQRSMVEQMKNGTWYIETMHTGHSPWLKDQPTVIRIIKDAVQRALE